MKQQNNTKQKPLPTPLQDKGNEWDKIDINDPDFDPTLKPEDKGNGHTHGVMQWKQSRGNNIYEHKIFIGMDTIAELDGENSVIVKANAARIVECWNNYDQLNEEVKTWIEESNHWKGQRNVLKADNQKQADTIKELLKALKKCSYQLQTWAELDSWDGEDEKAYTQAEKAIAKHNQ